MSTFGNGWETLSTEYQLYYMCFSDDGKLYAIGTLPNESDSLKYTEYYIRANLDGTQLEILDSEEINWLEW